MTLHKCLNKTQTRFTRINPPEPACATDDPDYAKISRFVTPLEWPVIAPVIARIRALKKEKNAVILAHNYMTPDIFSCLSDVSGDSLALAKKAASLDADIILQAGVHFMAETSKILNPHRKVLIPDEGAGCSLAESITAQDVRYLKEKYPGIPVVVYVNTSAAVKAEADICCTSSNALDVVESFDSDTVLFLPDRYLAKNISRYTDKTIITWDGSCIVHETFAAEDVASLRRSYPGVRILAHPECPSEVVDAADFSGSTSAMSNFVSNEKPEKVALITECSMSDNVALNNPHTTFIRPCNLCPYMKKITLDRIVHCLENEEVEIHIKPRVRERARLAIDAMLNIPARQSALSLPPRTGGAYIVEHTRA